MQTPNSRLNKRFRVYRTRFELWTIDLTLAEISQKVRLHKEPYLITLKPMMQFHNCYFRLEFANFQVLRKVLV